MRFLVALALRSISWLLASLGMRRAIRLGHALGLFVFYCLPIRRQVVLNNLAGAFPEKPGHERWRIARDVYRQLGRVLIEIIVLPRIPLTEVAALVRMHNAELIDAALAQGKGVVVCMGHMGNWELVGYEGRRRGYRFCAITKRLRGAINAPIHDARGALFEELPAKDSFPAALAALRSNMALALVIDQHHPGPRSVPVSFLGRPAATTPSPAVFHLRSGAPVLTAWMTLADDGAYDIWIRGPFPLPPAATQTEQIRMHTQLLASDLESFIRAQPSQWYWVHRRWKVPQAASQPMGQLEASHTG